MDFKIQYLTTDFRFPLLKIMDFFREAVCHVQLTLKITNLEIRNLIITNLKNNEPQNNEPWNNEPWNNEPWNNEPRNNEPRNNKPRNNELFQGDGFCIYAVNYIPNNKFTPNIKPFLGNRVVRYLSVNCTKLESIYQTILG